MIAKKHSNLKYINVLLNSKYVIKNKFFNIFYDIKKDNKKKPLFFVTNISKKIIKKSSERNLYKRWIRAVYYKERKNILDKNILIMPKSNIKNLKSFKEIEKELLPLLKKTQK